MKRTGPEGEGESKVWRKKGLMAQVIPCFFTFYSSFNFTNRFLHGPIQTSFLLLVAAAIAKVAPMLRYNPFWNSIPACCKAHHEYSILLHTCSQAQTSMHTCWVWISRGRIIMCSMQYSEAESSLHACWSSMPGWESWSRPERLSSNSVRCRLEAANLLSWNSAFVLSPLSWGPSFGFPSGF